MLSSCLASIKWSSRSLSRTRSALPSSHSKTLYCIHWPKLFKALKIRPRRLSSRISYETTTNISSPPTEDQILTNHKGLVPFQLSLNVLGENPRLQLKTTLIGRFILEDWMLNLGRFALLIVQQKFLASFRRKAVHFSQADGKSLTWMMRLLRQLNTIES